MAQWTEGRGNSHHVRGRVELKVSSQLARPQKRYRVDCATNCPLGDLFLSARKTARQDKYPRGAVDGGNRNRRGSRHGTINEIASFVVHRGIDAWNRGTREDSFHNIALRYYYLVACHEISAHQVQRNSGLIEGSIIEFSLKQSAQPLRVPHMIGEAKQTQQRSPGEP